MIITISKHSTKLKAKFLRGVALAILITTFGGALNANAYDVCIDDNNVLNDIYDTNGIYDPTDPQDRSACVHEQMARYGFDVYAANPFAGNTGTFELYRAQDGAGHEDEIDHVYGYNGSAVTLSHFWNPDPFGGSSFFPYNRDILDGIGFFAGPLPGNFEKSEAHWSRALGEYAIGNNGQKSGSYHYLGHMVHLLGDNTVPTHAHHTSHAPANRDSYENWMSNKHHTGFPTAELSDIREETMTSNHKLDPTELSALTTAHIPKLDRIDPLPYVDLNFDIPEVDGTSETPRQKLLWLFYTTNQIAEFFAADRDNGEMNDPSPGGWARADLEKMFDAGIKPTTESEMSFNDSCDGDPDCIEVVDITNGNLSNIREYSYIRGLRAIGGLYNLFEQTVKTEPIINVAISKLEINSGNCDDATALPACEAFANVEIGGLKGRNKGDQIEVGEGQFVHITKWNWGNTVSDATAGSDGTKIRMKISIEDDDGDFNADDSIDVSPLPFSSDVELEVDVQKCNAGETDAIKLVGTALDRFTLGACGKVITTTADQDYQGTAGGSLNFTIDISEIDDIIDITDNTNPVINCDAPDDLWHGDDVGVACTASDAGSGLADPSDKSFTLSTDVPSGIETHDASTGTREVCDNSGNCVTAGPISGNKIDKKAPTISIAQPMAIEYLHSDTLILDYNVTDGGSGVDTVSPTLNGSPTLDGSNLSSGQSIDLLMALPLGDHNFSVNADDMVDNESDPESVDFSIIVTPNSIIDAVDQLADDGAIKRNLVNSLQSKLKNAQKKLSRKQCKASNNMYGAFINEINAQNGKGITVEAANILITDAIYLIENCED